MMLGLALALALSTLAKAQGQTTPSNTGTTVSNTAMACAGPRTTGELRSLLLEGYDKYTRPGVYESIQMGGLSGEGLMSTPPETARIQLHVLSLNGVHQKKNQYDLSIWFRRTWMDSRLRFKPTSEGGCFSDGDKVGFGEEILQDIWVPDFYIDNQANPNKETAGSVWVYPSGQVLWVSQLETTLACKMVFKEFPYDTQVCGFRVGTYLEDARSVLLDFIEDMDPVTIGNQEDKEVGLPHGGTTEWTIAGSRPMIRNKQAGALQEESFVEIEFDLQRNSDYYNSFVMVPAIMFVVIGWAAFFINRSAAPARVAYSMIGFLANTNFLAAQLGQLPRLGNDVWLLRFLSMSSYFSFYGILEYVFCNYLGRIEARLDGARKKALEARNNDTEKAPQYPSFVSKAEIMATGFRMRADLILINSRGEMYIKDEQLDIFSRYTYPIVYVGCFLGLWYTR